MKIVFLRSSNPFAVNNAGTNRWRTLVEGLTEKGVEFHVLITQGYSVPNEYTKYKTRGEVSGIHYTYTLPRPNTNLFFRRLSKYILAPVFQGLNSIVSRRAIRRINPDIIWVEFNLNVFETYLKLNLPPANSPKLLIELNEFEDIGITHATNRFQNIYSHKFRETLLFRILPGVDFMVVMTKKLLEHYLNYANKSDIRTLHLPMTVDLKRFDKTRYDGEKNYIAYCGSTSFLKDGVDILIRSYSKLVEIYPDIRLKIAAPMEIDSQKMLALIKQLKLEEKIDYLGALDREEIPQFLTEAKLLVLPRPASKQAEGGFPMKLGEYLSTGNPVCVTTVGEIPDYLKDGENAFFAHPGSIDSFTATMKRALSDPVGANIVGQNGRKIAEQHFSMEVQSKRLYSFLTETLNNQANV